MAEKIRLSENDASEIAFDEHEEYRVIEEVRGDSRRWLQAVETIVKRVSDGKLFLLAWDRGLTEMQEHDFFGCSLVEVERKTKAVEVTYYDEVAA